MAKSIALNQTQTTYNASVGFNSSDVYSVCAVAITANGSNLTPGTRTFTAAGGTLGNGTNTQGGGAAAGASVGVAPFASKGVYGAAEPNIHGYAYGGAGGALNYNGGEANGYSLIYSDSPYYPYQAGGTGGSSGGGGGAGGQGPYGISGVPGSNGTAGATPTKGYGCGGGGGSGNAKGGDGTPGFVRIYCFTAYNL